MSEEDRTYTWEEGMQACKESANSSSTTLLYFEDELEAKIIELEYFQNQDEIHWLAGNYSSGNIQLYQLMI